MSLNKPVKFRASRGRFKRKGHGDLKRNVMSITLYHIDIFGIC